MAYVKILDCRTHTHVHNLVDYIMQDQKTLNGLLVTCHGCNKDSIVKDFEIIRKQYHKNNGILAHQLIQSFKKDEVTPEQAHELAKELAERTLTGYQYVITTHVDAEDNINSHIEFNSVSYLTGKKFSNNLTALAIVRKASNDISLEHGLSIIADKPHLKGIDKKTYESAMRGRSWKVNLVNDLDILMKSCKSMNELVDLLKQQGYTVKITEKHITIFKQGYEKGIRLDTLAKQFGSQYTKENLERHFAGEEIDHTQALSFNVKYDENKSEWQKWEREYFKSKDDNIRKGVMRAEVKMMFKLKRSISSSKSLSSMAVRQMIFLFLYLNRRNRNDYKKAKEYIKKQKNKKYTIDNVKKPIDRIFGNVSYKTITTSFGETQTFKIPIEKIIEMESLNIFYSGVLKQNGNAYVTIKKIHADYVSEKLNIQVLRKPEELRQERMREKTRSNKSAPRKEELIFYNVTLAELQKLDELNLNFDYVSRGKDYKISFYESDYKSICEALGKDYNVEFKNFEKQRNSKAYAYLKNVVSYNSSEKIIYRVLDTEYFEKIKNKFTFTMAYFEKDNGKVNIAFLGSKEASYQKIIEEERNKQLQVQEEQGKKQNRLLSL